MSENNAFAAVKTLLEEKGQLSAAPKPKEIEEVEEVEIEEPEQLLDEETPEEIEEVEEGEVDGDEDITETPNASNDDSFTPASLAADIGWDASDIYDMDIPLESGEPIKLGKLKDEYTNLSKEREALHAQLQEKDEEIKNAAAGGFEAQNLSHGMISALGDMDTIQKQYNSIDWDEKEREDPGRAVLLKQRYKDAYAEAQANLAQAEHDVEAIRQQNLQKAAVKLMEVVPEWKQPEVRQADQAEIRQLMLNEGYSNQMISSIADPIALKLLRELAGYRKKFASAKDAVKRVRKAPKVLSATGRRKPVDNTKEVATLKNKAKNARPSEKRSAELDAVKAIIANHR
jgi:hypothetical protein